MTQRIKPAPVRKSVKVAVGSERAFEVFTKDIGRWWPASHTLLKAPRQSLTIEPKIGGRWFERAVDGSECSLGHVLAWEPPHRVLLAWQIDGTWKFNAALVTEVEIRFIADGDATRVELEHRKLERLGEHAEAMRGTVDSPGGWTAVLQSYVDLIGR
ncbi:MAG: SRPBCC domain-containing protein [Proteobacteria bacterium]|nr:SRPBCC domain-containing protein [Pseudomonadota bacterium]MBI3497842.1 SRPBCC domain-containing protein [Pseudomonadota bacterium]